MRSTVLQRTRVLAVVTGIGALALPLAAMGPARAVHAAGARIGGTATSQPGSTAPTSFTFRRQNGLTATVNVSATTAVNRRYGGHTNIGAVSSGDKLKLWGTFGTGGTVFDATRIDDNSIQGADAFGRGKIVSIDTATNSFTAHLNGGLFSARAQSTVTITVPAGQTIPLPQGGTATLAGVHVGDTIYVRGVYNRVSKSFTSYDALRVLKVVTAPALTGSVSVGGFAFKRHHFAVVLVHTVPAASVQIDIHVGTRTITVKGTANTAGNLQTVRQLGVGAWSTSQHIETVVSLTSGTAQRTLTHWTWIA